MTIPFQMPNIQPQQVQSQPNFGQAFLQSLLQGSNLAFQAQEQRSQGALRGAQTSAITSEIAQRAETSADEAEANRGLQVISSSTAGVTTESISQALAKMKRPGAIRLFIERVPSLGKALSAPAAMQSEQANAITASSQASVAQAETPTRVELAKVRERSLPLARKWLENPGMPLPKDPTIGEAVAAQVLEILPLLNQRMENERQQAGSATQEKIMLRQAVMGAYQQAAQARAELAKGSESGALLPSLRDLVPQFLPAGIDPPAAEQILREATSRYFEDKGVPLSIPDQLVPLTQGAYYQEQDTATRRNLMDAAYAVSQGGKLAPTIDPKAKRWIEQAARALGTQQTTRQRPSSLAPSPRPGPRVPVTQ